MATLTAKQRAQLPDSAFAYIDSSGKRRLPINDASHVRNALSRFSQVAFEDDAARDRARLRLLNAAKKFGIMPIGFISAQLEPQRKLPRGQVTFLLADIEGSTELLQRLGDDYASLLADVRRVVRAPVRAAKAHGCPHGATTCSPCSSRPGGARRRARDPARDASAYVAGGHWSAGCESACAAAAQLTETGYVGISVHAAARICFSAHGGQIVLSAAKVGVGRRG